MKIKYKPKKIAKTLKKPWVASVVVLAIIAIAGGVFLLVNRNPKNPTIKTASGQTIVDVCQKKNDLSFGCYKKEINNIVAKQGPQPAFDLVKQQYTKEPIVKSLCHQLVHTIGRAAYSKYEDLADTFSKGDQFCWSGYYHGVMEQVAVEKGVDYLTNNAAAICQGLADKQKYSFYHFNCVHGLGHGFMEVLDANLFDSLKGCDRMKDQWESTSCYGGVFMQNIMNVQSPDNTVDHKSDYLRPDEPMYPCTAVDQKYKEQCYLTQTSYALQVKSYDFNEIFRLCSGVDPDYIATCYQSLGRDASGQSVSDVTKTHDTCMLGPSAGAQTNCIIGAAKDFVSYFHNDKQAYQLCETFEGDLQRVCKDTTKSYYSTF